MTAQPPRHHPPPADPTNSKVRKGRAKAGRGFRETSSSRWFS